MLLNVTDERNRRVWKLKSGRMTPEKTTGQSVFVWLVTSIKNDLRSNKPPQLHHYLALFGVGTISIWVALKITGWTTQPTAQAVTFLITGSLISG